MENLSKRKVM